MSCDLNLMYFYPHHCPSSAFTRAGRFASIGFSAAFICEVPGTPQNQMLCPVPNDVQLYLKGELAHFVCQVRIWTLRRDLGHHSGCVQWLQETESQPRIISLKEIFTYDQFDVSVHLDPRSGRKFSCCTNCPTINVCLIGGFAFLWINIVGLWVGIDGLCLFSA